MQIIVAQTKEDFPINEFADSNWEKAKEISIENYWSGEKADVGRHVKAKLLWSENALYLRFEANQTEPLIISKTPNLKTKTIGLWDRDVCEIFVAPNPKKSNEYFEFEIAPTGEWLDLKIYQLFSERETDFKFDSGMQSAAKIEKDKVWTAIKVEWKAFGKTPQANEIWKGNLFRCVGAGKTRGYLAWSPTLTTEPNFHVPEAFGEFQFIK
ncbi:MAG: carbohydrate-binding family 9-like protein [Acidobacteriota bacterium]|nr:carbohydrate-binding family 9-like protein [Acidobacteriota bacterium]